MSLINDALRRASQNDAETAPPPAPAPASPTPPPLQPVEPASGSPWPSLVGLGLGLLAVVGLLGLGGWFAWKAVVSSQKPALTASAREAHPSKPLSLGSPKPASEAPTAAVAPDEALPESRDVSAASATQAAPPAAVASTPPPAAVAPAPPQPVVKWPALKLQGIYYRPPRSSVMINSKTLFLDEEIQGVRVVEIGPQLARVILGGQTNTLHLR